MHFEGKRMRIHTSWLWLNREQETVRDQLVAANDAATEGENFEQPRPVAARGSSGSEL